MRELVVYENGQGDQRAYNHRITRLFAEHLAKNGLRLTSPRRLILEQFLRTDRHLSQEDIFHAVRPHGVGRATVFRMLKMLQECGLLSPIVGHGGATRFEIELNRPHHDHLICIECGRILEVRWPNLEKIQDAACRKAGFRPKWHRHEVFGVCRSCSSKSAAL
ncbi:MAG: Fur family transcriptional regulator [Elusimicrobiota bacterium]